MSLILSNPTDVTSDITFFLKQTFAVTRKQVAIIGVSGGIDSALSLTLCARSLPKECIFPVFLPHHNQPMNDALLIAEWNQIPKENWITIDVKPMVDVSCQQLGGCETDPMRKGNIKARMRMIMLFDIAKQKDGLVVGTENKSEHYLGYFTRFGDEASDIEPLQHLYKTQVKQLAQHVQMPQQIIDKAPSAGLWSGQTDEAELGFSYDQADQVLYQFFDQKKSVDQTKGIERNVVDQVLRRVKAVEFKHQVPYRVQK